MNKYTIYCTSEQTRRALELGAPIKYKTKNILHIDGAIYPEIEEDSFGNPKYIIPTTEQMIGWLEEQLIPQGYSIEIIRNFRDYWIDDSGLKCGNHFIEYNSRQEATLAAIDAALEYLINK